MWKEEDHPRNRAGEFANKQEQKLAELKRVYDSDAPSFAAKEKNGRIKVGEITSPIYDNMVLSNGRKVKDIVTRAVEMPLTGSVGIEHIEDHKERKGMVEHYIGFMDDIINDPDYVFEDKNHEDSVLIAKEIDSNVIMAVSLNFDNLDYTNTLITMRTEDRQSFQGTIRMYEKIKKVLYKKPKA